MATPFCRRRLSTILCIKDQYITIQYSALQNCIVQYNVVQYNTELPCNVNCCTTVHDEVQDKFIFNSSSSVYLGPRSHPEWVFFRKVLSKVAPKNA